MNSNLIITIGREYGTGGREIGQKLALRLGVPFYDRELITRAAKKTGFDEKLFEQLDKRATNSFLYSLTMFGSVGLNGMSLTDQLYLAQSNIIREMAEDSSCVIVGRCADHVLRDFPNKFDFFIHGSIEDRVKRVQTCGDYVIEGKTPRLLSKRWISSVLPITITIPARYGASATITTSALTQAVWALNIPPILFWSTSIA